MIEQFYNVHSIAVGIAKILLLAATGYLLSVRGIVRKEGFEGLGKVLLWLCLPALIITRITSTFDPTKLAGWWVLPLASLGMSIVGLGVGYAFQLPLKNFSARREFMSTCAFQNCGYLPIALVAFVCSGPFCSKLLVNIFLFIIGFNLAVWSFVPVFLSRNLKDFKARSVLNPPLIATVASVISVFVAGKEWVPPLLYDPLRMLGDATFPLALVVLGGYLAEDKGHIPRNGMALASCLVAKLIALPLLTFFILRFSHLDSAFKFLIFLEATMPSAVSLAIIGSYTKADNRFITGMIFYSHLFALITIPLGLYAFRVFI